MQIPCSWSNFESFEELTTIVVNKARQKVAVIWAEKVEMDTMPLGGGKLLKVSKMSQTKGR